ncbi:hypothetical protein [Alistipes putredinis]|uniref:hypothetical protein n=1 Tax=Alistipes putredinis TaxID=28117 RepID=UPI0027B94F14|nr:hypothetical protein [Alistipes putredinis]
MDNFEIIDFNTLERRKRKAILNHAIKDMDRVAMQRKKEGLEPRFLLQFNNLIQVEKLHHGNN